MGAGTSLAAVFLQHTTCLSFASRLSDSGAHMGPPPASILETNVAVWCRAMRCSPVHRVNNIRPLQLEAVQIIYGARIGGGTRIKVCKEWMDTERTANLIDGDSI